MFSCSSEDPNIDCPANCIVDSWNWTLQCFQTSTKPDTLMVVGQTLDHCMPGNSFNMNKTSCLSLKVNGGKLSKPHFCSYLYIHSLKKNPNIKQDVCMLCVLTYGFQGCSIKPDTAQKCNRSIYIPADSRNHCDKNLTNDRCINFTPG